MHSGCRKLRILGRALRSIECQLRLLSMRHRLFIILPRPFGNLLYQIHTAKTSRYSNWAHIIRLTTLRHWWRSQMLLDSFDTGRIWTACEQLRPQATERHPEWDSRVNVGDLGFDHPICSGVDIKSEPFTKIPVSFCDLFKEPFRWRSNWYAIFVKMSTNVSFPCFNQDKK